MEKERNTLVLNLLSGPGCLKSATAAGVFSLLKLHMVDCELVTEYAKDLTWEDRLNTLEDQAYVFAKQNKRLKRVVGKVDIIVSDTSLLLSQVYNTGSLGEVFEKGMLDVYNTYNNLNIILTRNTEIKYEEFGRKESLYQSKSIDNAVKDVLEKNEIDYITLVPSYESINYITELILNRLGKEMIMRIKE